MSSERGKNGRGVIKKEQKTEGRLKEEKEDVRQTATRIGTVEQFLKQHELLYTRLRPFACFEGNLDLRLKVPKCK